VLTFRGVFKAFGSVAALDNVSVDFEPGRVHALLGPNGSGKSTLMKIAVGLVKPDAGYVSLNGVNPLLNPIEARRVVGYLPEEPILYESLTPAEWFSFLGHIYRIPTLVLKERVEALVKAFKLEEHMGKLCGELSLGNKRKVQIIGALLHMPKVLIFDEPFSGLDPEVAVVLKTFLRRAAEGVGTVIFSTHVMELAEAVADEVTIMHRGRVVAKGPIADLKGKKDLESYFLEVTGLSSELKELVEALKSLRTEA